MTLSKLLKLSKVWNCQKWKIVMIFKMGKSDLSKLSIIAKITPSASIVYHFWYFLSVLDYYQFVQLKPKVIKESHSMYWVSKTQISNL